MLRRRDIRDRSIPPFRSDVRGRRTLWSPPSPLPRDEWGFHELDAFFGPVEQEQELLEQPFIYREKDELCIHVTTNFTSDPTKVHREVTRKRVGSKFKLGEALP